MNLCAQNFEGDPNVKSPMWYAPLRNGGSKLLSRKCVLFKSFLSESFFCSKRPCYETHSASTTLGGGFCGGHSRPPSGLNAFLKKSSMEA